MTVLAYVAFRAPAPKYTGKVQRTLLSDGSTLVVRGDGLWVREYPRRDGVLPVGLYIDGVEYLRLLYGVTDEHAKRQAAEDQGDAA